MNLAAVKPPTSLIHLEITLVALLPRRARFPHFPVLLLALLGVPNDHAGHLPLRSTFSTAFDDMRESNLELLLAQDNFGPRTHAIIRVVLDRSALVDVAEDLVVQQASADEAVRAGNVHLVLWWHGHEGLRPLELDADEVTCAVHADVVLAR